MRNCAATITVAIMTTSSFLTGASADEPKTAKVFILAGQSNMEGKAPNTLLDYQAEDPKTRDQFKHLRKDLGSPNLPFVIAAMGQNGSKPAAGVDDEAGT